MAELASVETGAGSTASRSMADTPLDRGSLDSSVFISACDELDAGVAAADEAAAPAALDNSSEAARRRLPARVEDTGAFAGVSTAAGDANAGAEGAVLAALDPETASIAAEAKVARPAFTMVNERGGGNTPAPAVVDAELD